MASVGFWDLPVVCLPEQFGYWVMPLVVHCFRCPEQIQSNVDVRSQAWGGPRESLFAVPALTGFKWWARLANPQQRKVLGPLVPGQGGCGWAWDGLSCETEQGGVGKGGQSSLGWDRGVWERREGELPVAKLWSSTQGCGERGNRVCLIPLRKCFYIFKCFFSWTSRVMYADTQV